MLSNVKNVIVYKEKGKFAGWPANSGKWQYGDEFVFGFWIGDLDLDIDEDEHRISSATRHLFAIARSVDGGETWEVNLQDDINGIKSKPRDENIVIPRIDFSHPGLALLFLGRSCYYSLDRGKTFSWLRNIPLFGQPDVLSRTDYIVLNENEVMVFLTYSKKNGKEGVPYAVKLSEGGQKMEFVSALCEEPDGFAIMPSTVRLSENEYVTSVRRCEDSKRFIETYYTNDDCKTWRLQGTAAVKAHSPGAMICPKDGVLAMTYGYRYEPYGINVIYSKDKGDTWSRPFSIRNDGGGWDLGYPFNFIRSDNKIVTVYYYNDSLDSERYIAASIWDIDEIL